GILDLTIFNNGRKSVARNIFFEKTLKVIRPVYLNGPDIPTFYIVNVGGGYLDGDLNKMYFTAEENAHVTVTLQGATKIYRTLNDHVKQYQKFTVKDNGYIKYVDEPIMAFAKAKLVQ